MSKTVFDLVKGKTNFVLSFSLFLALKQIKKTPGAGSNNINNLVLSILG